MEERTNNQYLFFDASDYLDQNRNKFVFFFFLPLLLCIMENR